MAKLKCDDVTNEFIKNHIYKNKIVIFGLSSCELTENLNKIFKEEYKHTSKIIYVDKLEVNDISMNSLKDCVLLKTKDLVLPKTYVNGMYLGGYKAVREIHFRKDLDVMLL